jgi:hypothetical protein
MAHFDRLNIDIVKTIFSKIDNIVDILKLCKTDRELNTICNDPEIYAIIKSRLVEKCEMLKDKFTSDISTHAYYENKSIGGQQAEYYYNMNIFAEENMSRIVSLIDRAKLADNNIERIKSIANEYMTIKNDYIQATDDAFN